MRSLHIKYNKEKCERMVVKTTMENFFIKCSSITYAQKAQRVLDQARIRSRMIKTSEMGCGYGLDISAPSKREALRILNSAGISYTL